MYYRQLRKSKRDKNYKLIPAKLNDEIFGEYVDNIDQDHYVSIYEYDEEQYKEFLKTGSIAGVKDVTTPRLVWDFDNVDDVEKAKQDTIFLIKRLAESGIQLEDLEITFSGKKGFGVSLETTDRFNVAEFKAITSNMAHNLSTYDDQVSDSARIIRLVGTKHDSTEWYKIPLSYDQLVDLSVDEIKQLATSLDNVTITPSYKQVNLPYSIMRYKEQTKKPEVKQFEEQFVKELEFSVKPKFLSNCRWALQNGYFKEGERSSAFLCLAATYKNQGFEIEHTYRILKGVAEIQAKRNDMDRFPDSELYNNIATQVYSNTWKNGQYSCREEGSWLNSYCQKLGLQRCNHKSEDDMKPSTLMDIRLPFKDYVKNIEKNTIHTGIKEIDQNVFLSTGANVGIIGAAGSGKSSIALNILNNTSKAGVRSVFASLDMAKNRMFEKVMYKVTGMRRDQLYAMFKSDKEASMMEDLQREFGNVNFFSKSSPTVSDVRDYIKACEDHYGEKIKLVMLDYFERVSSDIGDDTAASKRVAGELQDLVNDLDICLITLVQPNKMALSGGADQPIYDYTKIKGSSYVYQAFRIIMSLWRPFYNPKDFSNDKYMQMATLKNDLGELSEFSFNWNGAKGEITSMEDFEYEEFRSLLAEKERKNGKRDDF